MPFANLSRIRKGKNCSAKRQCSVILTSGTKQSRAAGKSSAALLSSCSLLPPLCCRALQYGVRSSWWLSPVNKEQSSHSPHAEFQAPRQTEREILKTFVDFFLIFFFNNASKHLQMWSHVTKHVALSWNYLQTAGSAGKRNGSHCALKAVPLKPCLVSTSALLKLA